MCDFVCNIKQKSTIMAAIWFPANKERYTPERVDEKLQAGFDVCLRASTFTEPPDLTKLQTPSYIQEVTDKGEFLGWIIHRDYSDVD
jgi:hypothetical protein